MSKKRSPMMALSLAAISSLLLASLGGCTPSAKETPATVATPEMADSSQYVVAASWPTARSLSEVVARSTIIVIGHCVETGKAFNSARLPQDPSQPDPALYEVAQVYRIGVEQYLKGNGPTMLDYAQVEGYINGVDADRSEESIQTARKGSGVPPLRQGLRYLFFLRPMDRFADTYVTGAIHPSRWVLEWDEAWPETPWIFADKVFPRRSTAELLREVEQRVAAEPPTPTAGPQPGEASQPTKTPAPSWVSTLRGITRSLVDLVGKSDIIVVGECEEVGRIFNGCVVSSDNPVPDPHNFCIQQVYRIRVERYLKGDGPDLVEYAQDEGWIPGADADRSPRAIELAKEGYDGAPSLRVGTRYVLFLRVGERTSCLLGVSSPDRWALERSEAVAELPRDADQSDSSEFGPQPEAAFLYKVEHYVGGNVPTPTPTVTPRPTALPADVWLEPPASKVSVGQTFTVALTIDTIVSVWGAEYRLSYDATKLHLDEVSEGTFFSSWATQNDASTFVVRQSVDSIAGAFDKAPLVGITLMGTRGDGPAGSGTVFTLRFTALADGVSSLKLSDVQVVRVVGGPTREVESIPVRALDGDVTVIAQAR